MKKAILAYSGGLDTSYCLVKYKSEGYEVHTVIVNTGGFGIEEVAQIEKRAYELGSTKHVTLDVTDKYYQNCIRYMIFGNVLKNNTYPLSVSAERIFQAMAIAQYAKDEKAKYIIHGSTGAGNDQIRFDLAFSLIAPDAEIITPIRDFGLTRQEEIEFLQKNGVDYKWEKAQYSINKGIWGTSVGGVETLTSDQSLPSDAYPTQLAEKEEKEITIGYRNGEAVALNGKEMKAVEIIKELNSLGGSYAIGRDTHVGDTILGIKGRVGFEAPAALILIKAHQLLEKHTLTRWQLLHKEQIGMWYGTLLHEAQFLDPIMRDFEAFLQSSQSMVTGEVRLKLMPYRFELQGVKSENDMMQSKLAKYGEENEGWDSRDARGFIKIFGNQLKIHHSIKNDH